MSTIPDYFKQAELALAAYANLFSGIAGNEFRIALEDGGKGMSPAQAAKFAETWRVIDQSPAAASGFSATVFEEVSSGKRYLAIRGTEGFFSIDTLADAQLLFGGAARNQIVSIYNYVQRLITPAGQPALQVEDAAPDIDLITGLVNDPGGIRQTASVAGLGYLAGASGITVAGHSLGGHLAAAASYLFPTLIGSTGTFNAPGFRLEYATALLGQFPGSAAAFPATITNLVAHAGADIVAAVGTLPGVPVRIEIENQLPNPVGNHSIVPLTDALALYNLFARLDPTVSVSAIGGIFSAASSSDTKTLEVTLASVGKLFGKTYPRTETTRDALYTNLYDLQGGLPAEGTFSVVSLVGMGADAMISAAKGDSLYLSPLSIRYALKELNPFLIDAPDAFYGPHNTGGRLDLYNPTTGQGELTDEYLTDRSAMLYWTLKYNAKDGLLTENIAGVTQWVFEDKATSTKIILSPKGYISGPESNLVFGRDDQGDTLTGGAWTDRLYGGGGVDHLYGYGGHDRLEGGAGNDELYGGDQDDVLVGGAGDDRLEGGRGFDTYIVGQGTDTIVDDDGLGVVKDGAGRLIAGAFIRGADGRYAWANDAVVTASRNSPLTLTLENGAQVVIDNYDDFAEGELGIRLQERPAMPEIDDIVQGDRNGLGEHEPIEDVFRISASATGNYRIEAGQLSDFVVGGIGNDRIAGNGTLFGVTRKSQSLRHGVALAR